MMVRNRDTIVSIHLVRITVRHPHAIDMPMDALTNNETENATAEAIRNALDPEHSDSDWHVAAHAERVD